VKQSSATATKGRRTRGSPERELSNDRVGHVFLRSNDFWRSLREVGSKSPSSAARRHPHLVCLEPVARDAAAVIASTNVSTKAVGISCPMTGTFRVHKTDAAEVAHRVRSPFKLVCIPVKQLVLDHHQTLAVRLPKRLHVITVTPSADFPCWIGKQLRCGCREVARFSQLRLTFFAYPCGPRDPLAGFCNRPGSCRPDS